MAYLTGTAEEAQAKKADAILGKALQRRELPVVGFTQSELDVAFRKVQSSIHWKEPIDAWVPVDELPITMLAVEFFTATKIKILGTRPDGTVLVHADGYRLGPAGDH